MLALSPDSPPYHPSGFCTTSPPPPPPPPPVMPSLAVMAPSPAPLPRARAPADVGGPLPSDIAVSAATVVHSVSPPTSANVSPSSSPGAGGPRSVVPPMGPAARGVVSPAVATPAYRGRVYILRGLSGSGKSTLAKQIAARSPGAVICSADKYFTDARGVYRFDRRKLSVAHDACLDSFIDALAAGTRSLIVDNTNAQCWEYRRYCSIAELAGYHVTILQLDCSGEDMAKRMNQRSVHRVPLEVELSMLGRWEPDERATVVTPYGLR